MRGFHCEIGATHPLASAKLEHPHRPTSQNILVNLLGALHLHIACCYAIVDVKYERLHGLVYETSDIECRIQYLYP